MSPDEAKKKVLEKWPKAQLASCSCGVKHITTDSPIYCTWTGANGMVFTHIGTGVTEDAAWIDAAQRINEEGK